MKSFSAILYVDAAVRSTGVAVQLPLASAWTADVTRLPAGWAMSYVKQSPDTCGNRPSTLGILDTPFSSIVFSSAPFTCSVTTMFPKGSTPSTWPRVIGNGGGVYSGQKSSGLSVVGHVRSARRPPELVIANWTPIGSAAYFVRIASVTTSPTSDSHVRPTLLPHWSARGMYFVELPIVPARIGLSWLFRSSIRAWIVGSGVIPMSHGLWKSAVL